MQANSHNTCNMKTYFEFPLCGDISGKKKEKHASALHQEGATITSFFLLMEVK